MDVETSEEYEAGGKVVINATGVFSNTIRRMDDAEAESIVEPSRGVHLVLDKSFLQGETAIMVPHTDDGRVLFVIPWRDMVYIGTTDTDYEGDPRDVAATDEDVTYILGVANHYFPDVKLLPEDVTATWAGLRPLIRAEGMSPSEVSREHTITIDPDGLISIAGGKLTTCRRMGAEVIDRALDWLELVGRNVAHTERVDTARAPLPGAVGWPEDDEEGDTVHQFVVDAVQGKLDSDICRYLTDRYGTRAIDLVAYAITDQKLLSPLAPGRPEILAQVDWAVTRELAVTVTDFMERRTQLFFRDRNQGLDAIEAVARRMGELLGWTDARREESAEAYRQEVALSRRWRLEGEEAAKAAPARR